MTTGGIRSALRTRLARNTGWMLASQLVQTVVQALYFVLVARALGVTSYGAFVAVAGLAAALGPFGMLGMSTVVMRNVSRDRGSLAGSWGNALAVTTVCGTLLTALVVLAGHWVLPAGSTVLLVASVAAADLVFANYQYVHAQLFLAVGLGKRSAQVPLILNFCRLAAAATLLAVAGTGASATTWSLLYLGSTALAALLGYVVAHRAFGRPALAPGRLRAGDVKDGGLYALGFSSATIYNDIDKPLVARLGSVEAAGAYAAGYRVVTIALAPIRSLLLAAFSGFFRHGSRGIGAAAGYALRLVPWAGAGGIVIGFGLVLCAPLAPLLFGPGFEDAADTIRLLAPLPLIKGLQNLGGDVLTGADHQLTRTVLQLGVTALNVGLNLWLIPLYSYRGAIAATLVCDVVLLVALWATVRVLVVRARRAGGTKADAGAEVVGDAR